MYTETARIGDPWRAPTAVLIEDFNNIAVGNSLFVAVGRKGGIFTSADGLDWTPENSPVRSDLYGACWSSRHATFVVSGDDGALLTSPDGFTWTQQATDLKGLPLHSVIWSEEVRLFAGVSGASLLVTSHDAINWNIQMCKSPRRCLAMLMNFWKQPAYAL